MYLSTIKNKIVYGKPKLIWVRTLILLLLFPISLSAQKVVTGTVKDYENLPLSGATIIVKGTNSGTVTDLDGKYSIQLDNDNDTLVFSFVGYIKEEIAVDGQSVINMQLIPDITGLEKVVVIGYGTQKKRDLTGSVATINTERIKDIPATNLTAALQGSVPGVSINSYTGAPGKESNVLIRGIKSVLASNDPLVIIDGIPGASINDVNPNDIESIQVLKDAAATSIYGSRASGGVIIITTKRGGNNKINVNYNGYFGLSFVANKVDVLSADEYVAKKREIYRVENSDYPEEDMISYDSSLSVPIEDILPQNELEMYTLGKSYNWLEEITRTAPIQGHSISVSGGDEKTIYYLSANMIDQTGVIYNSGFKKYTVNGNISSRFTKWLKIGTNLMFIRSNQDIAPDGIFRSTYQLSPLGKKYEDEENPGEYTLSPMYPDEYIANPFTEIEILDKRLKNKFLNTTFIEFNPINGLSLQARLNTVVYNYKRNQFTPLRTRQVQAFDKAENAAIEYEDRINLNFETLITYNKTLGQHSFVGTFVFSTEEYKRDWLRSYARNFGSDYYQWTALQYGQVDFRDMESLEERTFLVSLIGRLNYNYAGKYLAQLSIRNDRSSKFSKENRNATFPGISVGWVISEESFLQNVNVLDNLKLRVSWAQSGNQAIGYRDRFNVGDKVYYTTGQDGQGQIVEGLVQTSLANKDLRWEISTEWNAGIDFQLLRGRLSGVLEMYKAVTTDLLWDQAISPITGYSSIRNNVGSLENKGLEIALDGIAIQKRNITLKVYTTFSANRNKILDLDGTKTDNVANRLFIGEPIGVVYDYVFDGIMQEGEEAPLYMPDLLPGEAKVKNIGSYVELEDGSTTMTNIPDTIINEADMTIIGQIHPKWYGSLGFSVNVKNFDVSVFINHVHGITRRIPINVSDRPHSMDLPYYTDENPSTQYGRPSWPKSLRRIGNQYGYLSYYVDASYTRLSDVTIGYNMSNKILNKINIERIRFYVTAQNLLTITDYKGYDPAFEFKEDKNQTEGNIATLQGYPTIKNILFGLNVTF